MGRLHLVILSIAILMLIFGAVWLLDKYLEGRMTQICRDLNMTYLYKDSASFYCMSNNPPLVIKEVKYG